MENELKITIEILPKENEVYIAEESSSGASYKFDNVKELAEKIYFYLDNYYKEEIEGAKEEIELDKIPLKLLEDYNISKFNNINEIFDFLFDEDFTKEDIIAMLTDKMKEELVLLNGNVIKNRDTFYYGQDIYSLEEDLKKSAIENNIDQVINDRVMFSTKIVREEPKIDYSNHNGEMVEILEFYKGKDIYNDRYTIKFNDGTIAEGILSCELDFDHYISGDRIYESEEEQEI